MPSTGNGAFLSVRGRRIVAGDTIDGYAAFKRLMNGYIEKYQIGVEIDDGIRITKAKILE
ncbi:hypothetical protein DWU98_05045 [Dyella monticola]|uniref:Uncharacterized protein n=1 Tax=Dyella monticola TaxID=1927958 RepID=A0A370X5J0_9GAMM|nr:hypothetical protein DWU98_05045 [Dyella monticola]